MSRTTETKTPEPSDRITLIGMTEITDMLIRITRGGAQNLTYRDDFPTPVAELIGGEVWQLEEVTDWISAHPEVLAETFRVAEHLSPLA